MPLAKSLKIAATIVLLASNPIAVAVPFASFDSRSMAMGGTGVAVSGVDAAPFFNPALLSATRDEDNFSLILPTVGARISDPDGLVSGIDQTQTDLDALQQSVDTFNVTLLPADASVVANNLRTLSSQLTAISNKPITAEAGISMVAGMPSKRFGAAFYATDMVTVSGILQYNDATTLTNLAADADTCANPLTLPAPKAIACFNVQTFNTSQLTSEVHLKGVIMGEAGFALSHKFQVFNHNLALGITPKLVKATLFDTAISVNNNVQSNSFADDNKAEYSFLNFDLGFAKEHNDGWRTGLVFKNALTKTLDFKRAITPGTTPEPTGETLTLKPQARFGVSHENDWSTVALDVDLSHNEPVGFGNNTRYVALGGEVSILKWAKLRAGYRYDTLNNKQNIVSFGLGISVSRTIHMDIAVANNEKETGGSFQLGAYF